MFQVKEDVMDNKKMKYWFLSKTVDIKNNSSYFIAANAKGLFKWNHNTNTVKLISDLSECDYDNELYDEGIVRNGIVYFPPKNTTKLLVYDIDNDKVEFEELYSEEIKKQIDFKASYYGHHVYKSNDDIYFFDREYPIVTILRTDGSKEVKLFNLEKKITMEKTFEKRDGILYFPLANSNYIIKFDTNIDEFDTIKINNNDGEGISSVLCEKDRLVMLSKDSKKILTYEFHGGIQNEVKLSMPELEKDNLYQLKQSKSNYVIMPLLDIKGRDRMNNVFVLDINFKLKETRSIDKVFCQKKKWSVDTYDNEEWYFAFEPVYYDDGDMFWTSNLELISLNYNTFKTTVVDFPMPEGFDEESMSERIISSQSDVLKRLSCINIESDRFGINDFINNFVFN